MKIEVLERSKVSRRDGGDDALEREISNLHFDTSYVQNLKLIKVLPNGVPQETLLICSYQITPNDTLY
jgi:hypothetical protein